MPLSFIQSVLAKTLLEKRQPLPFRELALRPRLRDDAQWDRTDSDSIKNKTLDFMCPNGVIFKVSVKIQYISTDLAM